MWDRCCIGTVLSATVSPDRGILAGLGTQVFTLHVKSHSQPAQITIMLNLSYNYTDQMEKYHLSLKAYDAEQKKLNGVFVITERGNYIPVGHPIDENSRVVKNMLIINYSRNSYGTSRASLRKKIWFCTFTSKRPTSS